MTQLEGEVLKTFGSPLIYTRCECDDACFLFFFFFGFRCWEPASFVSLINISMGFQNITSSPFPIGSTTTAAEGNHLLTWCKQPSVWGWEMNGLMNASFSLTALELQALVAGLTAPICQQDAAEVLRWLATLLYNLSASISRLLDTFSCTTNFSVRRKTWEVNNLCYQEELNLQSPWMGKHCIVTDCSLSSCYAYQKMGNEK